MCIYRKNVYTYIYLYHENRKGEHLEKGEISKKGTGRQSSERATKNKVQKHCEDVTVKLFPCM